MGPSRESRIGPRALRALLIMVIMLVIGLNVVMASLMPHGGGSGSDTKGQPAAATTMASDDQEASERSALGLWLEGRGGDATGATRLSTRTEEVSYDGVAHPVERTTSYWRIGDACYRVITEEGHMSVSAVTAAEAGVGDGTADGQGSVESVPEACMATLYGRLAQWGADNAHDVSTDEARIVDGSVSTDGSVTTFVMSAPDADRRAVTVMVSYDASSDQTSFELG